MSKQSQSKWALVLGLFVGVNAAVVAQSQNSASDSNSTSTTSMATSSATTMKTGGSTGKDLAISAAKSADHTILFRALRVSGVTEQAAGKGPYTVFAPTNDAFNQLPAGALDELMKPAAKNKLINLLAGHVVKGKYTADQLQDGQKLKTVTGKTLTVSKQGETVTISDAAGNTANVNQVDIEATNGVIHSIDTILGPAASGK